MQSLEARVDKYTEDKVKECWNKALESYGTAYIFEQRANRYRRRLDILQFLGIAVPVSVGAIVLSFEIEWIPFPIITFIAGVIGLVQLIFSVWSSITKWQDTYTYAVESRTSNDNLAEHYKRLANNHDQPNFSSELEILQVKDRSRRDLDYRQGITESEKRMGMRAALRKYERECATCGEVPKSMEPSNCGTCGNFKRRRW